VFTLSTPGISVAGHIGGFLGGGLLGLLFSGRQQSKTPPSSASIGAGSSKTSPYV
jgi:membrane associated rhomboid family serine protease